MDVFGYAGAIIMGFALGLIGGGGSILSVPIFVYLFSITPTVATAYSLFVVGLVALVGGVQNFVKNQVDIKVGTLFAIPSFIGVFGVRRFIMPTLPTEIFHYEPFILTKDILIMSVFALVMLIASKSMIQKKKNLKPLSMSDTRRAFIIIAEGLIVGGVTGFVGAGGGFLIVPALVLLVGLNMKVAVGTSLLIIATKSLIGFLGDIGHTSMDWKFLMSFTVLALGGMLVGTYANQFVPAEKLKSLFGWFVLIMGVFILGSQWF